MLWKKLFKSRRRSIEAQQVALVAATVALDLDWDGDRPTTKAVSEWPKFSEKPQDEDCTASNCCLLDREQIYFQAFVIEQCLPMIRTTTVRLSQVILTAWDYYLENLPQSHGVSFDYKTWCQRRATYVQAWHNADIKRAQNSDMLKNPFYSIAMALVRDVCGLSPDVLTVVPITLAATEMENSFAMMAEKWIVDREC
jgi:hypothetical protein